MNRQSFLKRIGLGMASLAVMPKILTEVPKEEEKTIHDLTPDLAKEFKVITIRDFQYPKLKDRCIDESLNLWFVKGLENRFGYGLPDRGRVVLKPLHVSPNKYGRIPDKLYVPMSTFKKNFKIVT